MYLVYLYFDDTDTIHPLTIAETEDLCKEYISQHVKTYGPRKTSSHKIMLLSKYIGGEI